MGGMSGALVLSAYADRILFTALPFAREDAIGVSLFVRGEGVKERTISGSIATVTLTPMVVDLPSIRPPGHPIKQGVN